jgi:hypothetical protein
VFLSILPIYWHYGLKSKPKIAKGLVLAPLLMPAKGWRIRPTFFHAYESILLFYYRGVMDDESKTKQPSPE